MRADVWIGWLCLGLAACSGGDTEATTAALDTDGNGHVDCQDLELVLACIHHPGGVGCGHADVDGDGQVDDADAHSLAAALEAHGIHCVAPPDQDAGTPHVDAGIPPHHDAAAPTHVDAGPHHVDAAPH